MIKVLVAVVLLTFLGFTNQAHADITTGLTGYWNFNEGSGTAAADSSGNGNTATLTNGPTWTAGKIGSGAVDLDGVDDVVALGSGLPSVTDFTFSAFVKLNSSAATEDQGHNTLWIAWPDKFLVGLAQCYAEASGEGGWCPPISSNLDQWVHFVLVRQGASLKVYRENSVVATLSAGSGSINLASSKLGSVSGYAFNGSIDDVRIYNRALSVGDISELYTYTGGTPPPSDTAAPSIPSNLSATAVSQTGINLTWSVSTDNVAVSGYKIYRGGIQIGTATTNSYSDSGLSASTVYSYTVSSYDAVSNNSSQSSSASATTQAASADTTPPTVSSITSSSLTSSGATISFTTNESSDTQIEYGLTTSYGSQTTLNASLVTSHSQSISSLTANTVYNYRVKSKDASGNLSTSGNNTFTTAAAPVSGGSTVTAASCSQSDVQAAINRAVDANTIQIPAGTCSWTQSVVVDATSRSLVIQGAGINQTIIIDNVSKTGNNDAALSVSTILNKTFRLTGFTFKGGGGGTGYKGSVVIGGTTQTLRIDNMNFDRLNDKDICINGWIYGVVDSSTFTAAAENSNAVCVNHDNWNNKSFGDGSWADDSYLGSEKAIFIENNIFTGGTVNDLDHGGRSVVRYNTINDAYVQTHNGTDRWRGSRTIEVYKNTFTYTPNVTRDAWPFAVIIRMGTGVVWGNKSTGYVNLVSVYNDRADGRGNTYFGLCNGSSSWDGNSLPNGYACIDQVGRGKGDLLQGVPPLNSVTNTASWPNQVLEPLYEWNNTYNIPPNNSNTGVLSSSNSGIMSEGRDYFLNTPKPGYTSYVYPHPLVSGSPVVTPPTSTYTLTVSKSGTGSGTVTGGSISCGSTCTQSSVSSGTSITLTAVAASGSTFTGWSGGGCSGTGACSTTVTANTTVTAMFNTSSGGSSITAATCSQVDVQTAINTAINGSVVVIPNGTCTWNSGITTSKQITIQGQTKGSVKLVMGSGISTYDTALFHITTGPSYSTEISNLQFWDGGSGRGTYILLDGAESDKPPLIHDNVFTSGNNLNFFEFITYRRYGGGIIYKNTFQSIYNLGTQLMGRGSIQVKDINGSASWSTPSTMGTFDTSGLNNVYIEENTFNNIVSFDSDDGSRVVFRNNILNNSPMASHGADTSPIGLRHTEIYDNQLIFNSSGTWTLNDINGNPVTGSYPLNIVRWYDSRGGTGVITGNVIPNILSQDWGDKAELALQIQQIDRLAGPDACVSSYPALHQVGRGMNNTSEPLYVWGNTGAGLPESPSIERSNYNECPGNPNQTNPGFYIQLNRDFYVGTPKPNWTRYPYPHPLRTGSSPVVTPPTSTYTLTVSKSGTGSGTVTGGSISCGSTCTQSSVSSGTSITLTAVAASGSTFTGWSGGGCSGTGACSTTVTANTTVTAMFNTTGVSDTTLPTVSITAPTNGSTVSGSSVSISATASDNIGVVGVQFKLDGTNLGSELSVSPYSGTWNTTSVSNGSHTLTATARDAAGNTRTSTVTITVSNSTADTTAPSTPTGITSSSLTQTGVTLSWLASVDNVAVSGYKLYRGGTLIASPLTNTYAVTGLTANTLYTFTVSAYDAAGNESSLSLPTSITTASVPVTTYTVTATKSGTGTGTISGNGISCGSTCSASITNGTTITLTATPNSDSTFTGWGGACTGTGSCTTTVTGVKAVSATFTLAPSGSGSSGSGSTSGGGGGAPVSAPTTGIFTPTVPQPTPTKPVVSCTTSTVTTTGTPFTRSLTVGSTGSDVKALQQFLNIRGFYVSLTGVGSKGNESTYFGPATAKAVAKFQAANGILPSSGLFGPITMKKVNSMLGTSTSVPCTTTTTVTTTSSTYTRSLTIGSTGNDVKALQVFLNAKGFKVANTGPGSPGSESTYFGPATTAALAKFQASKGIVPAAGYFGPLTMKVVMSIK